MSHLVELLEFLTNVLYAEAAAHALLDVSEQAHREDRAREATDNRTPCAKCGFMVHGGEDVCPICGTPTRQADRKLTREDGVKRERVTYCKKCGYQIFSDDTECGYCHYPVIRKDDSRT